MTEYIPRSAVYGLAFDIPNPNGPGECEVVEVDKIDRIPAADVAPVVRGRWMYYPGDEVPYCSNCTKPLYEEKPYCPNCGAKMEDAE